jgi:hypothetical protein
MNFQKENDMSDKLDIRSSQRWCFFFRPAAKQSSNKTTVELLIHFCDRGIRISVHWWERLAKIKRLVVF